MDLRRVAHAPRVLRPATRRVHLAAGDHGWARFAKCLRRAAKDDKRLACATLRYFSPTLSPCFLFRF